MENNRIEEARKVTQFYQTINLIFHAVLAPPLVAMLWLYLEINNGEILPAGESDILEVVLPIVSVLIIGVAFYMFKSALSKIDNGLTLIDKINQYQTRSIILYAQLEGAAIISVLGYYLSHADIFLGMYMVVLVFFSLYKPTFYRIGNHLNLSKDDRDLLINSRNIVREVGS